MRENGAADALARVFRIHKECPYFSGLGAGIELGGAAFGMMVASEQRAPATPAAAADDPASRFNDKIGSVPDQLCVDAECPMQGAFDLRRGVVRRAELPRRARDERFQRFPILKSGFTQFVTQKMAFGNLLSFGIR